MVKDATDGDADARASLLASWVIDAPAVLGAAGPAVSSRLLMVGGSNKRVRVRDQGAASEGGAAWPTSTDRWCWHCCHPFAGQPLPMPIVYDDRRDCFHVMGTFCGWACMKAYNLESTSYKKHISSNVITMFRKRCTGHLRGLRAAPPKMALKVFGGAMSIEQFREASDAQREYAVLPPNMIVHHHCIQELDTSQPQFKQKVKPAPDLGAVVNFKDVSTKNETLRLKRPKPLQSNRNLLERTMGIGLAG